MADEPQYVYEDSSPESHLGEASPSDSPMIPKHRFDEVLKREQAAIKERDDLKRQLTEREPPPEPTYSEDDLKGIDQRVRDLPAFREMSEWKSHVEQEKQAAKEMFLRQAETKFATFAEKLGVGKDDQDTIFELQSVVAEKIRQNPELAVRFRQNDLSALEEAYEKASSGGLISALRRKSKVAVQAVKERGPQPPRDVAKAVAPEKKEEVAPLSERDIWDRTHERAWDKARAAVGEE